MSLQAILTSLLLPPLLLVLLALAGGLLALRRRGLGALLVLLSSGLILFLATPFAAGHLLASLETGFDRPTDPNNPPRAVIILSGDAAHDLSGLQPGPLTLERMAAGVRLARARNLPVLVTGGRFSPSDPPIAQVMAEALAADFALPPRWIEPEAHDTRENALLSAEILRRDGITAAWLVTHAWHMRRSLEAFDRAGLAVVPAPVRIDRVPDGRLTDWLPRADHLGDSWFALREWAGRLVYRLRDGPAVAAGGGRQ